MKRLLLALFFLLTASAAYAGGPGPYSYTAPKQPFPNTVDQIMAPSSGASFTASATNGSMAPTAMGTNSGQIAVGQVLSGAGVSPGTVVVAMSGNTNGGLGTYTISPSQTFSSTTVTAVGDPRCTATPQTIPNCGPIITLGETSSSISGGVTTGPSNAAFRVLGTTSFGNYNSTTYYGNTNNLAIPDVEQAYNNASLVELPQIRFNTSCDLMVDNAFVLPGAITTDANGTVIYQKLDWSTNLQPNKNRLYTLYCFNHLFGGMISSSEGVVSYPYDQLAVPLVSGFGDSYLQSTGAAGPARTQTGIMARQEGLMLAPVDAVGGTGFCSTGANAPLTRVAAITGTFNFNPALYVIPFGYNDAVQTCTGTVQSVSTSLLNYLKTSPITSHSVIVPFEPWCPNGCSYAGGTGVPSGTQIAAVRTAYAAGALQAGFPNLASLSGVQTAGNQTLFGLGDGPTGYSVHYNHLGQEWLGKAMALSLRAYLNSIKVTLPGPIGMNSVGQAGILLAANDNHRFTKAEWFDDGRRAAR